MLEALLSSVASKIGGEALSKWKERKQLTALLDQHKLAILAVRMAPNRWAELSRLRDFFLKHGLAKRNAANKEFFDKWLTDPVVEMGYTPGGGWTLEKIAALNSDVEKLSV
jgi:hypothetical protein